MSIEDIKKQLLDLLDRVLNGERIVFAYGGKDVAALVSVEDLKLLEEVPAKISARLDLDDRRGNRATASRPKKSVKSKAKRRSRRS